MVGVQTTGDMGSVGYARRVPYSRRVQSRGEKEWPGGGGMCYYLSLTGRRFVGAATFLQVPCKQ